MAERFKQKAEAASPSDSDCSVSGLRNGLNYCNTNITSFGGNVTVSNPVLFVYGDLTITSPVTVSGSTNTATFIVSGNVTVNTGVTRIDGVYITGETFTTTDAASGGSGSQLKINGAVYGANVNLNRKLSASAVCADGVTPCTNAAQPAEKIVYDPKYLIGPNATGLLGSPGVAWKEVAP